jgi:hypothetical protein
MARPATSPAARLRKLNAALPKAKALRRGSKLTAQPMADLLGVRWVTLREWCDDITGFEDSGAFVRGGNGIEWEFKPVATVRFLIGHFDKTAKRGAQRAKRMRQVIAGDGLEAVPDDYSLPEIKQLLDASGRFQELRERQARQVDVEHVTKPLRQVFERMRNAGLRAVQESDPNGRWPPETRAIVESVARKILADQDRAARDCLGTIGGRTAQPGAAG